MPNNNRRDKITNLIKELAADFLASKSSKISLITLTDCTISSDFKKATIYLSVLPESMENKALDFTKRQMGEFRTFLKQKLRIKTIPSIYPVIDTGEKHRQKINRLLGA